MDTVLKIVKDMDVLDKFLKPKGRFVGDMVHISIADLADCFRNCAPQWQTIESELHQEISEHAKTADELAFWKYQATYYHAGFTVGHHPSENEVEYSRKLLEHYQQNEAVMDAQHEQPLPAPPEVG